MNALEEFVTIVADELGGMLVKNGENLVLELPERQPIVIDSYQKKQQCSRDRLEFVEKQAAIVLLADPNSFAVSVMDDAWPHDMDMTILRVAFVYYVVNGVRCYQRYTAYYGQQNDIAAVLVGNDNLFSSSVDIAETNFKLSDMAAVTPKLGSLIESAYQHFIAGQKQTQEFQRIFEHRRDQIFDLDLLYKRRSVHHLRTFGVSLSDLKSRPSSVSAEYQRRRLDVETRHIPRIAATILSVGLVNSPARVQNGLFQMPFLPLPADQNWLELEDDSLN